MIEVGFSCQMSDRMPTIFRFRHTLCIFCSKKPCSISNILLPTTMILKAVKLIAVLHCSLAFLLFILQGRLLPTLLYDSLTLATQHEPQHQSFHLISYMATKYGIVSLGPQPPTIPTGRNFWQRPKHESGQCKGPKSLAVLFNTVQQNSNI